MPLLPKEPEIEPETIFELPDPWRVAHVRSRQEKVLARQVTLVPILRAGLGMADGVLKLLPDARLGHLGVKRNEQTLEPVSYYQKLPPDIARCAATSWPA